MYTKNCLNQKKTFVLFRINFDVACNMDFRNYPADDQSCELKFESFGLQSNQVHLLDETIDIYRGGF